VEGLEKAKRADWGVLWGVGKGGGDKLYVSKGKKGTWAKKIKFGRSQKKSKETTK